MSSYWSRRTPAQAVWAILLVILLRVLKSDAVPMQARQMYESLANFSETLLNMTTTALDAIFDKYDKVPLDESRLYIQIKSSAPIDEGQLDNCLLAKPWWIISFVAIDSKESWILLQRAPKRANEKIRYMAGRNLPSPTTCENRPLHLEQLSTDTWGNYFSLISGRPREDSIYAIFSSDTAGFNFVGAECTAVNRWSCFFLPSTNCTLPTTIKPENALFNKSTASATPITPESIQGVFPSLANDRNYGFDSGPIKRIMTVESTLTVRLETTSLSERSPSISYGVLFPFAMLFRFKTAFAKLVYEMEETWRNSFLVPFNPTERCVTVHIRRGDRTRRGVHLKLTQMHVKQSEINRVHGHISRFCQNYTKFNDRSEPEFQKGPDNPFLSSYGQWEDLGCRMKIPYEGTTLEHYINASRLLLPDVKTVYVMTDDAIALPGEVKRYQERFPPGHPRHVNLYAFVARKDHRVKSINHTAEFWASVMVAQQCEGFVGYYGSSAASRFISQSMSFRNKGNTFMEAVNLFDFGNRIQKSDREHLNN